ncbi:hypothetical protein [Chitinophaga sp.]|uniref:hypothetical protein n=1 Tax=Chitinophaga sp. TaxID=1869181 RepID=UPI0031DC62EA
MNRRNGIMTAITLLTLLVVFYWFHGSSYTQLQPIQVDDGKMVVIPLTNNMIRNFPAVLQYYHVPYTINGSGLLMIPVRYARDRDLLLTMTNCTLDSTQMKMIRGK